MRPLKATLIALQYAHKAEEGVPTNSHKPIHKNEIDR